MKRSAIGISAVFHIAIFLVAMVSWPWLKKDFVIPPPVSVELVDISKVTETNKVSPQPAAKPEKDKPNPAKPPPAAKNTASEPVAPVQKPPKQEEKNVEPKKDKAEVTDENVLPEKKKDKKKKEEKKKEAPPEPQRDFSSILKNLADPQETPSVATDQPDLKLDEKAAASAGQNAPLGEKMTMSEEDALRHQLETCWNVPFGAKDAENLRVEVFMVINPDRTLREARIVDVSRYNSDSFFRAAADSAMRAVRNPLCSPFQLPPDKYDTWKTVTVTFDPSQMF